MTHRGLEGLSPLLLIFCLSLLTLFGISQFFTHSDIPTNAAQCANQVTLRGAFRIGRRTFETLIFVQRHPLGPRSTETLTTSSHFVKLVMYPPVVNEHFFGSLRLHERHAVNGHMQYVDHMLVPGLRDTWTHRVHQRLLGVRRVGTHGLRGLQVQPSTRPSTTPDFLSWSPIGSSRWRRRLALIAQIGWFLGVQRGVAHGPRGLQVQPSTRPSRRPGFPFFRGL